METTKLDDLNSSNQKAPDLKLAIISEKTRNEPGLSRCFARMKPFKHVLATITENIEGERLEEEIAKLSADGIGLTGIDTNPSVGPSRVPDWLTQQDDADLLEPIPTETNQTELGGLKRITLKMMESASIPKNCFVTLRAKGKKSHGMNCSHILFCAILTLANHGKHFAILCEFALTRSSLLHKNPV